MRYVYIDLKTNLSSTSIRTEATYSSGLRGAGCWELRDAGTGQIILTLPASVQELRPGTLYEDDAIRVRV